RLAVVLRLPAALAVDHDVDAVIAQDALEQIDVGEARDIVENECLVGEQARDHQRQGGVLCAGDRDRSIEPLAAVNTKAIHAAPLDPKRRPKTRPPPRGLGRTALLTLSTILAGNSGGIVRR